MKKIILISAFIPMFIACKNNAKTNTAGADPTVTTTQAPQTVVVQKPVVQKEVRYVDRTSNPAQPAKKGWSKAAKGTLIGAGSGAVVGAVVSKNSRGKGAVIGGVVGGTAGYLLGRSKDKKDGRVRQ